MTARRKKSASIDTFEVEDFLRPTDSDLRSALHSLLGSAHGLLPEPEVLNSTPGPELTEIVNSIPGPELRAPRPRKVKAEVTVEIVNSIPGPELTEEDAPREIKRRQFPVREAASAAEGHSRAENLVYDALWREAAPGDDPAYRSITIGILSLARMAGISESNTRINLRSLMRKLAVEQESQFYCEQSRGYTWRVYSPEAVLARRQSAGLRWYSKRTLAVVFVDPDTKAPLLAD